MRKIKILMVLGTLNNGGTEAFVMNYFRNLDREKYEIDFLIFYGRNEYFKNEIIDKHGKLYRLSSDIKNSYFLNMFREFQFLSKRRYDIIHIHSCSLKFMIQAAVPAKLRNNSKIIGHAHSAGEPKDNIMDRLIRKILISICSNIVDVAASCSNDSAINKFNRKIIKSDRYFLIPNAIKTENYVFDFDKRKEIRNKYKIGENTVIGIIGRLEKEKNQSFLIDVLREVNKNTDSFLMIVGEGDIRADLEKKVRKNKLEKRVIFTGEVSNAQDYYSAMDIFCLPSFAEGFPFVLVEAQVNGLLCLVSDDITTETNISETVEYLDRNNVLEWADRILKGNVDRISREAVNKVTYKYDIGNATKILESVYEQLISN